MSEIINVQIESTKLGFDRGFLNFWLNVTWGSSEQEFGGYVMDEYDKETNERKGHAFGTECIIQLLKTVGVEQWENLKGKYIRIEKEIEWSSPIIAIGHITEDKWFNPTKLGSQYF